MISPEPVRLRIQRTDNNWLAWLLARYRVAPDHPTKLRLWRWLYTLAGRPEVRVRYAGRARLQLDLEDLVQRDIAQYGSYEPEVWDSLAAFAVGDEVLWDVGGHVGGVAIRAALDPRVRVVHCFEPNPRTAAQLRANLELNPDLPVTHHPVALGDRRETLTLHFGDSGNIGQASLVVRPTPDGIPVECVTADAWESAGNADPPTLLKIDVEGYEREVLVGASKILASGGVKAIVFEAEVDEQGRLTSDEIPTLLGRYGYTVRPLRRPDGSLCPRENFLAARSSPRQDVTG